MIAPFFGVGHLLALIAGAPRDGFSWPYQATAAAAGFVYALFGLVVLASVLRRWFGRDTVVLTLLATTFGTNLFHYATYDSLFSHAFSFALVAVVMRLTIAVADLPRARPTAALAASVGLLMLVRPTNLDILAFCALYGAATCATCGAVCTRSLATSISSRLGAASSYWWRSHRSRTGTPSPET